MTIFTKYVSHGFPPLIPRLFSYRNNPTHRGALNGRAEIIPVNLIQVILAEEIEMRYLTKKDLSILLGNALDNFDTAIYSFLAPLLAPLFFPHHDPIVQLILAYSVLMTSFFSRPLGAYIFGVMARKHGPIHGLSYSLIGVAIGTVLTGFLPTYETIEWFAPLGLVALRMAKGIFAAGESTIAKLYLMEDKADTHALKVSHLYQSSSMLGTILASGAATIVIAFQPDAWRLCFWLGGITGFLGYFLRRYNNQWTSSRNLEKLSFSLAFLNSGMTPFGWWKSSTSNLKSLWVHRSNILRVSLGVGFGHITYSLPFVFMNSFIPLITSISLETMMILNTTLLVFDMVMIPFVGRFLIRFEATTVMVAASLVLALTIIPLFAYLPNASLGYVIFVRLWIVFWGVVFLCPLNFWFKTLFNTPEQYLLVGMGTALGASAIGRSTTPLCLWLWYMSDLPTVPALYIGIFMLITAYGIQTTQKRKGIVLQDAS